MKKNKLNISDVAIIPIFSAIIAVCSWISVTIGVVPINFALFAVYLSAGLLGVYKSAVSVLIYIMLGAFSLPVFAGFSGGIGVLLGSTGGYIAGYLLTAVIVSIGFKYIKNSIIQIVFMLLGLCACYLFGTLWFVFVMKTDFLSALLVCVVPFIVFDILKIAGSYILIKKLRKLNVFRN